MLSPALPRRARARSNRAARLPPRPGSPATLHRPPNAIDAQQSEPGHLPRLGVVVFRLGRSERSGVAVAEPFQHPVDRAIKRGLIRRRGGLGPYVTQRPANRHRENLDRSIFRSNVNQTSQRAGDCAPPGPPGPPSAQPSLPAARATPGHATRQQQERGKSDQDPERQRMLCGRERQASGSSIGYPLAWRSQLLPFLLCVVINQKVERVVPNAPRASCGEAAPP